MTEGRTRNWGAVRAGPVLILQDYQAPATSDMILETGDTATTEAAGPLAARS